MERGLIDTKGELFAIMRGTELYTLEGEKTGRIEGRFIVDLAGRPIWLLNGDGVYKLDGLEPVGYLGQGRPIDWEFRD